MASKKIIKYFCVTLLLGSTIYLCFRNFQLHRQVNQLQVKQNHSNKSKSDTVFITKPFNPIGAYPITEIPNLVTYYLPDSHANSAHSIDQVKGDHLLQLLKPDSLVQILLDEKSLRISFKDDSLSSYFSKDFELDLSSYKYNFINNSLTKYKKSIFAKLKPYAYISYRYPQNLGDLGLGIGFKTQKVIYKVGMNGFWYPSFKKDPGLNLEFRLEYNL